MKKSAHTRSWRINALRTLVLFIALIVVICVLIGVLVSRHRQAKATTRSASLVTLEQVTDTTFEVPPTVNPMVYLNSINLSVPEGQLYSVQWLNQWHEQILQAIQGFDDAHTPMPTELYNMVRAWALLNYLCTEATSNITDETIPIMIARNSTCESGVLDDLHAYSSANAEHAAVTWCVLNRVSFEHPDIFVPEQHSFEEIAQIITNVVKAPYQFAYQYNQNPYPGHEELSIDVLCRWVLEGYGLKEDVGRTLPQEYRFFSAVGDGWHNRFRTLWEGGYSCKYWDWTLPDPYVVRS